MSYDPRLVALARAINPAQRDVDPLLELNSSDQLPALARDHRVEALLVEALTADHADRSERLPESVRHELRRAVMTRQGEWSQLSDATAKMAEALDAAGIRFVLLKGAALAAGFYPQPHLRPMTDIDFLVAERDVDAALEALEKSGFHLPVEQDLQFWKRSYYNLPLRSADGAVNLEMHWSIAQPDRHRVDVDALLEDSRPIDERRVVGARALGATDLLLHQVLHHSYHTFQPRLIWLYDIALLLLREAPNVDDVFARARSWGMQRVLALSLRQVDRAFPGVVPAEYSARASRSGRAKFVEKRFGDREGIRVVRNWNARKTQLAVTLLMMDGPLQTARALSGFASRVLRFGDRAGHKKRVEVG